MKISNISTLLSPSDTYQIYLIAVGDILISSGLDGVFPGGLPIAVVTAVAPLEEGAFSYTINARLLAGDLDEIDHVRVLPPLFSSKEHDEKNLN